MPHSTSGQTLQDAASFRITSRAWFCMAGMQILVGQALAISGGRGMTSQATAITNLVGPIPAEVITWSLGIALILLSYFRGTHFWAALGYVGYNIVLISAIARHDAYIAGLYLVYCMFGMVMVAASRPAKGDA